MPPALSTTLRRVPAIDRRDRHRPAVQPDGRIPPSATSDLGGAKSTNIARFLPEGTPDTAQRHAHDRRAENTVAVRLNGAPVPTQLAGFAWLNPNGTLRPAFNPTTRLSARSPPLRCRPMAACSSVVHSRIRQHHRRQSRSLQRHPRVDNSFDPAPNGAVTSIAVQTDGRTSSRRLHHREDVVRNRIGLNDADGRST
jgi:hypothetical protein